MRRFRVPLFADGLLGESPHADAITDAAARQKSVYRLI
jgi:hypothetical protein